METYDLVHYFDANDGLAQEQQKFAEIHDAAFNAGVDLPKVPRVGLPQAYVATDTNTVIIEMQESWGKPPHPPLLFFANQTRYELGTILQLRTKAGSVNKNEEAYNAIKDIWFLSEVRCFCHLLFHDFVGVPCLATGKCKARTPCMYGTVTRVEEA